MNSRNSWPIALIIKPLGRIDFRNRGERYFLNLNILGKLDQAIYIQQWSS
jgi:hypothetical protein